MIQVNRLFEGQLFHVLFPAIVEAHVLREYDDLMVEQLDTALGKIHFIADLSNLKSLPNLSVLVGLRHPYHHNIGYGLTIGLTNNLVGRFLVSKGAEIMGVHHRDFSTFNEAQDYLHQMEGIR